MQIVAGLLIAFLATSNALAQASRWVGTWTMDVQGSNRQRTLLISQDGGALRVVYGWKEPGAKLGSVDATLDTAGVSTFKTNSESTIVLSLADDQTIRGQVTNRDGRVHLATLSRSDGPSATTPGAASEAGTAPTPGNRPESADAATSAPAIATLAAPAFLDRAAVEALVVGHKLVFERHRDKNKVSWAVDKNGMLYGENFSQNSRDTARWNLTDTGELCLKWRGNSNDVCSLFTQRDGKTMMIDKTSPTVIYATIRK